VLEKQKGKGLVSPAIVIFSVQLVLNALWSILFFGLKMPMLAFFEIIFLWLAIAATILKFRTVDVRAAYLLVPYILWVSFAALLNLFVWLLNP
ncbi:MAG: tryptophan-rich sensory protein, partial [Candidatus Micrarchaeota archaeon]|nr:tryptophan-rich sensory protein [Candidatus Micrarchaeota archaeon]